MSSPRLKWCQACGGSDELNNELNACIFRGTFRKMTDDLKPIPLQFWKSNTGREPTRDWFKNLPVGDRAVFGKDLKRVQYGWPLGMPLVKSVGDGLWEIRTSLPSRREARAIFVVDEDGIVVLHGFIKKSQKTPIADLNLARKRMKGLDDEN